MTVSTWAVAAGVYGLALTLAGLTQPIARRPIAVVACISYALVAIGAGSERLRTGGSLRDVAPTVLRLLDIEPPADMTGRDLRDC